MQSLQVAPERPRPGHLYACTLVAGRATPAARTSSSSGSKKAACFRRPTEDAVLLDARARGDLAGAAPSTDRIDEAVYAVLARLAPSLAHGERHLQLLVPRHARVPRDLRLLADAAGVSAAAGRRGALVSADEGGARRAESVVPADRDARVVVERLVAAQRRRHRQRRASTPSSAAFAGVARGRDGRGRRARPTRSPSSTATCPTAGAVLDPCAPANAVSVTELEKRRRVSVPLLPQARPRPPARGRARARQGRLARSADARLGAARPLRGAAAPLPRRQAAGPTRRRTARWLTAARAGAARRSCSARCRRRPTEILERESKDFLADVELFLEARVRRRLDRDADRLRGVVRPAAGRRRRAAGAGGAGRDRSRQRADVPDRRPHRPHRPGRPGVVRGPRLQDRRLLARQLEGHVRRRPSPPARALRAGRGRAAEGAATRSRRSPAGVYYFSSHKGRQERVRIAAPAQRGDRRRAGRPARA